MRNERLVSAAFVIMAAAFLAGVGMLFYLRTEAGDIYPAYSSLRADPSGSRALYESLETLDVLRVSRNYVPLDQLHSSGAVFYIGAKLSALAEQPKFERLLNNGARIIIGFTPEQGELKASPWGFGVKSTVQKDGELLLHFQNLAADWTVLEKRDGFPVVIERPFGKGSLVLSADSYPFSNEAMLSDRESAMLSRIIGDKREIVFDESHLGTEEEISVGALARRYHLQGVFLALLMLVGLFLWKSTSSFLPPPPDVEIMDAVSGRSSRLGLMNLLKRSVPATELLAVCSAEWLKTSRLNSPSKLQRIQNALGSEQKDALRTYQTIYQILKERH
jgi:hypothetical protein